MLSGAVVEVAKLILDAKMGTVLLAEGDSEQKRDFLKKNRFELSDGGEIAGCGVQKTVESIGRIQFRTKYKTRRLRRNFVKIKLAERGGFEPHSFARK
jgi:hypothetical protein